MKRGLSAGRSAVWVCVWLCVQLGPLHAQQPDIPAGMELIKVGDTNVLVPQGTKVTRRGAQLILEPIDEYTARRMRDLEASLAALRAQTEELKKQVERLAGALERLQQAGPVLPAAEKIGKGTP